MAGNRKHHKPVARSLPSKESRQDTAKDGQRDVADEEEQGPNFLEEAAQIAECIQPGMLKKLADVSILIAKANLSGRLDFKAVEKLATELNDLAGKNDITRHAKEVHGGPDHDTF